MTETGKDPSSGSGTLFGNGSWARARARRARWLARSGRDRALELSPAAYCWFHSKLTDDHPVLPRTELVIEGYMGSGNSFAREAFRLANPGVAVASHRHSTAQLARARSLGIPILWLVRDPEDAVASYVARHEVLRVGRELRRYEQLYRAAVDALDGGAAIVVASFDEVTSDFGSVVVRVNASFGTSFVPFSQTPEDVARIRSIMDSYNQAMFGDDYGVRGALPNAQRRERTEALKGELRLPRHQERFRRCKELYSAVAARIPA